MRQIVSYADIAPPSEDPSSAAVMEGSNNGHITKKFKHRNSSYPLPPTSSASTEAEPRQTGVAFEESRELTHGEIWDDSALIEAWNAATEEYEALNGPHKSWKSEPIHKAPLWYNIPATKTKKLGSQATVSVLSASVDDIVDDNDAEGDSKPLDFATYVPTYNPNLEPSSEMLQSLGPVNTPNVAATSQDEAFSHAINAMYWTGYWTAIYHVGDFNVF
ncbi:hypothetical protein AX15_005757 [Amanita polypyramis BW_CC]|nr:hypothetical protein AX15_005757 [Amanita polypyramis BW_CC]